MTRRSADEAAALDSLVRGLRAGAQVSDLHFDRIFPDWARRLSELHWTPVDVARRAAKLLSVDSTTRVLDIGSGVGKFCLIGALTTRACFFGIEQRGSLVDAARDAAGRVGAARAKFLHGNMRNLDWDEFDCFYLFNPFYENVAEALTRMDADGIDLSPEYYHHYVQVTCEKLSSARIGTRVALYSGFGATMPYGYRLLVREPAGGSYLELYEKESPSSALLDEPDEDHWN